MCVNISFKTLISDPYFVQMHLKKSKRNSHITAISQPYSNRVVTFTNISRLLEDNSSTTIHYDPFCRLVENDGRWWVAGSCNGLLCLIDWKASQLCLWNPATRTKSEFFYVPMSCHHLKQFSFGFDESNESYKVVKYHIEVEHGNARSVAKVFSLGDKCWRNIRCFPVLYNITIEQPMILSLDLSTETYTQLLLPRGFHKLPRYQPTLKVLRDNLCIFHDFEGTHFVMWQMKDFGVQESWIQLFKISYNNLSIRKGFNWLGLLPLYLSKNGDTLVLAKGNKACFYNCIDNKVVEIGITNEIYWSNAKNYVESLVPTH
ncbi:putative F-box associated interaction domain-containing protein [Medicago truncatula]|uniref:Putative F-box associated interaction domain-containing protein n=1 Tax=Medicago truncatula TaxID=3880 RepID=A0A396KB13_MEDTR|nr:putative F-box associated interaction domain-containing protein [Medicago truncatula]